MTSHVPARSGLWLVFAVVSVLTARLAGGDIPVDLSQLSRDSARVNWVALRHAADDLARTWPEECGAEHPGWLAAIDRAAKDWDAVHAGVAAGRAEAVARAREALLLQRRILLANPLVRSLDGLLLVRRSVKAPRLGLPQNWESNCVLPRTGYDNDLVRMSPVAPDGELVSVYQPKDDTFIGDLELHCDATRLLISKSDPAKPWQVYELNVDGSGLRQVTPDMGSDVNNYDGCYLPNGDVLFTSTATMVAVPCVNGGSHVANIYRLSKDGGSVRQLCFDQEHNWCPTVLEDGRILYLRWEYTDLPHSNSRRLFQMNPDGTAQMVFYGTSSYWPNGVFYARPIPGHPSQVVGIVTGHHGVPRMGELVLFDAQAGRSEAEGALQRFPGSGRKVERVVKDAVVDASWPKFLHPFPLGRSDGRGAGRYFLVACQPSAESLWGIYLIDGHDNLLRLSEQPGYALLEPVPIQVQPAPPVLPDRIDPTRRDALVFMADVYAGPGLKGLPRGVVKSLRVFTYVYGYRGMGGLYGTIGMDGPWDIRRILGTVAVEPDGSALFRVPANTPIAVQPLDAEGKALQLMRSWFTAMPGEVLSCVGCHEARNSTPVARGTLAAQRAPSEILPWRGPSRGFGFAREVQPVLDARCIGCHNGSTRGPRGPLMSLRGDEPMAPWNSKLPGMQNRDWGGKFTVAYANLHRYVRHPGIESDLQTLVPMDFHADTTELVQILRKGHHGVTLTDEDWDRLSTWIDLNTPFHGDWSTIAGDAAVQCERRRAELRLAYGRVDEYHIDPPPPTAAIPASPPPRVEATPASGLPPSGPVVRGSARPTQTIDLGGGVRMAFAYVPPGEFSMGSSMGPADEQPLQRVILPRGFWMAVTETSNEQYRRFAPDHDSRREDVQGYQFGMEGYPLFEARQPVVRVNWYQAVAFCGWLSARTGLKVTLPTESQWEYACRAGQTSAFSFGESDSDFSAYANLADRRTREFACDTYLHDTYVPLPDPTDSDDWLPKDVRFDDGHLVSAPVGSYRPNPWGFHDLHGNVAEWTRSQYRPYPYVEDDGRNQLDGDAPRTVRGGSWRDRPYRATSSYRLAYRPYQPVFNVGFRVVIDDDPLVIATVNKTE